VPATTGSDPITTLKANLDALPRVFLATQFLGSMETQPVPLIAEVMDIDRSIRAVISGIQLSEETAVGRYPTRCVRLLLHIHRSVTEHAAQGVECASSRPGRAEMMAGGLPQSNRQVA
jgi:pyruvate kinase